MTWARTAASKSGQNFITVNWWSFSDTTNLQKFWNLVPTDQSCTRAISCDDGNFLFFKCIVFHFLCCISFFMSQIWALLSVFQSCGACPILIYLHSLLMNSCCVCSFTSLDTSTGTLKSVLLFQIWIFFFLTVITITILFVNGLHLSHLDAYITAWSLTSFLIHFFYLTRRLLTEFLI